MDAGRRRGVPGSLLLAAARLALAPVLLMQGRRVRGIAQRLPEAAGPREAVAGTGGQALRVLLVGDSAIAGVGAADQREALAGRLADGLARRLAAGAGSVHWRLVARTGATTADAIALLDQAALASGGGIAADVAIVGLGVNDLTGQVPAARWLRTLDALADRLRERHGARLLLFCGLPPMHLFPLLPQPLRWYLGSAARRYDRALAHWTLGRPGCAHVPMPAMADPALMAVDGFHPGPGAYAVWGDALAGTVLAELSSMESAGAAASPRDAARPGLQTAPMRAGPAGGGAAKIDAGPRT